MITPKLGIASRRLAVEGRSRKRNDLPGNTGRILQYVNGGKANDTQAPLFKKSRSQTIRDRTIRVVMDPAIELDR